MSAFADQLNHLLDTTNGFLYGSVLLVLLLFSGVYFSVRTRVVQFRMAKEGIRLLFQEGEDKEAISGFQALMVSCASRLGVGNITGVASAIIIGGPGAIFWMWIMAALGGASAFVESTLAQLYKVKTPEGGFQGGPSYYLVKIFKRRWVGVVFALSLIFTFSYGFQMLQANAVTAALQQNFGDSPMVAYGAAILMSALTAYGVFGGQKVVAKVSEVIVPIMAVGFLVVSLAVIALNYRSLPRVFGQIFSMAFDFRSAAGGFAGTAISIGLRRGLYSNEAGMGSAPNAAGTVDDTHPAKQGLVQMLAVFIDTLILCTATALLILCPGVPYAGQDGGYAMPLVQAAVQSQFGTFGIWFVSISVIFFAFGTIIGNIYYVETNIYYIWHRAPSTLFRLTIIVGVFIGCIIKAELAWNLADFTMSIMVLLNFPALMILANKAIRVLKDYEAQRKRGVDPIYFYAPGIGIDDTDCWNEKKEEKIPVAETVSSPAD